MADGDNLYLYRDGKRCTLVEGTETHRRFLEMGWSPDEPQAEAEEPVAEEPVTTEPVAEEPVAAEPVIDEEKVEDAATPSGRGRRRGR